LISSACAQIAGKINKFIREYGLRDIGQVEQDLVFGDAGAKEVINLLRSKQVCIERNLKRLTAKSLSA
jgi:syntaxin-binding protein 1